jgi:hypothetical protein
VQASEGTGGLASELPLGQWEVDRLEARHDLLPRQLLQASPALSLRRCGAWAGLGHCCCCFCRRCHFAAVLLLLSLP